MDEKAHAAGARARGFVAPGVSKAGEARRPAGWAADEAEEPMRPEPMRPRSR